LDLFKASEVSRAFPKSRAKQCSPCGTEMNRGWRWESRAPALPSKVLSPILFHLYVFLFSETTIQMRIACTLLKTLSSTAKVIAADLKKSK
jgi:hypothetical protein